MTGKTAGETPAPQKHALLPEVLRDSYGRFAQSSLTGKLPARRRRYENHPKLDTLPLGT
jgi:hypothetical protein